MGRKQPITPQAGTQRTGEKTLLKNDCKSMKEKAILKRCTTLHQGRVFQLDQEEVVLPNGTTAEIDLIRHPGAAGIVPWITPAHVLLLRQYRHAAGGFIWEIPAGTLISGESPEACAYRELMEETGYVAARMEKLGEVLPLPGYSDECIHLYLATELSPANQHLDEDEVLEVHTVTMKEAMAMILDGRIRDSKTVAGLFLAYHHMGLGETILP